MPRADKDELVWQFSNMTTTSLRELYCTNPDSYKQMLDYMNESVQLISGKQASPAVKRLRSAILTRIQRHGVDTTNWSNVNSFLKSSKIAGKPLYELTIPEMQQLIQKLELILKKDELQRIQEERLSMLN
jgi:hypothetical protein